MSSGAPDRAAAEPEVVSAAVVDGRLAAGALKRPWLAPAYGLGLMMKTAAGRDPFMGHSGEGTTNAAVYHFPARRPAVTVGIFAPTRDIALVERRAVAAARALQE